MLLEIYKNYHFTIAEIPDCNYDAVSKAFEMIGHPEYALNPEDIKSLEVDTDYDLYDWDDIATAMVEQDKKDLSDVDLDYVSSIGTITVHSEKYIEIDQE